MDAAQSQESASGTSRWRERQLLGIPIAVVLGLGGVAGLAALVAGWLG